jgi:hypothetical protein
MGFIGPPGGASPGWSESGEQFRLQKPVRRIRRQVSPGVVQTAEAAQYDWLMTRTELESQGLSHLAADVARFRQSLKVSLTQQERAESAVRRDRVQRPPAQIEFAR